MTRYMIVGVLFLFSVLATPAQARSFSCKGMIGVVIPRSVSTHALDGGKVTSAEEADSGNTSFCRLRGELAPMGRMAWPIRFQINLPENWNNEAAQYGGGGTNGVLISAEGAAPDAPPGVPTPLQRGFATFGTDAGHPILQPDAQLFAFNDEAVENMAYASYKKVYDAAKFLIRRYYGRPATRVYFIGNSEGGREALIGAQRRPQDYAGVLAVVPAFNWAGQHLAHYQEWEAQLNGGWIEPEKLKVVQRKVLDACDQLDGLKDGVVSQYLACSAHFDPAVLACAGSGEDCLSAAQVAFLRLMYGRKRFPFPLSNSIDSYPGSPYGGEAAAGSGVIPSLMVSQPPQRGDLGRPLAGAGVCPLLLCS